MTQQPTIGIDVGGTKLAGVVTCDGLVLAERRRGRSGRPLEEQVIAMARELVAEMAEPPLAIGLAVPGQVDTATGMMELAVNLDARPVPIRALVEAALGIPCHVDHDARVVAAWLAERDGVPSSFAFVSVGTGISAGVAVDGRIVRGVDGLAGEIGHVLADLDGDRCGCGLRGCLETIASGPAVARTAAKAVAGGQGSSLGPRPSTTEVYAAAAHGDTVAVGAVERAAVHLAAGIRGLALMFGLSRVYVGGGVSRAGDAFSRPLRAALERQAAESPLVARALPSSSVEVLADDLPIGALGAASIARLAIARTASRGEEVRQR